MRFSRFTLWFVYSLLALSSLTISAFAQTSRGTLSGTVTDSSHAVIPNVTVKITQQGTGTARQTTTNSAGIYRFDAVDLGIYSVSAQATGFATEDRTGVEIASARTTNVDFSLKIGTANQVVTVEATGNELALQTSEQVRSAVLSEASITKLPILGGDSLTLAQLAPGIASGSQANTNTINQNGTLFFAVNGQRPRGNNFMIDGVENNDISITGPAFTISNPDSVQEVVVQTANFSAEYGRAGGAILNQITKSGTNSYHGSVAWVYTGSALRALNHLEKAAGLTRPPRRVQNIPDFTFGGPVVIPGLYNGHDKTFFFAAGLWDRRYGNSTSTVRVPDPAGIALLQSLAPACPNAALYLKALGNLVGNPANSPSSISLNVPSGACNGGGARTATLTTGQVLRSESAPRLENNHTIRIDHIASDKQTMSFRWLYDRTTQSPNGLNNLPGFDSSFSGRTMSGLFTDTYVISPTWTNEFRFNYGRLGFDFPRVATAADAFHFNLPNYSLIANGVTPFGVATNIPQFRFANNWQYQDTMSLVRGKHTFRFGVDYLRQLARQHPPFNERGSFVYAASTGVTAFANFLDDFGGTSGNLNRQFGISIYHPNLFRQAYFFQDSWKATPNLTLNLGLRYEYYGAPENTFTTPAFTNYDPVNFAAPNKVPSAKLNFGPSLGLAWNPNGSSLLDRIAGGEKMVWRAGFQISYDSSFNNLLSNIAGSSPNTLGGTITSPSAGRGSATFSTLFAGIAATPATAQSAQSNLFLGSFPNPRTARWSLGFQRELPWGLFWDTSYVGSVSHHLYQTLDMNPIVNAATGVRFQPQVGIRTVRAAKANSNYESAQFNLRRGFKSTPVGELQFDGSYTYSHFLDNASDVFAFDSSPTSFQSAPQVLGFSPHIDYGNSDFDRRHVGSIEFSWTPPQPKNSIVNAVLGGWTFSGISHWQDGVPFTVSNGKDRGGFGQTAAERPDISNTSAPFNSRAVLASTTPPATNPAALPGNGWCPSGYSNPDGTPPPGLTLVCADPSTVYWIEGKGSPNAHTVGRNTLRTPFQDNLDFSVAKRFTFTEKTGMEFRADMFNAFNTTVLGFDPTGLVFVPRTVNGSTAGHFLDFTQTDSIGRTMRLRAKFYF
jgi:outer membrane receptor protein involved in Fe transport